MHSTTRDNLIAAAKRLLAVTPAGLPERDHLQQAIDAVRSDPTQTLDRAAAETWSIAAKGGGDCPLCTQRVQIYARDLDCGLAYALMFFHQNTVVYGDVDGWINMPQHAPRAVLRAKNFQLLKHWTLIERRSKSNNRNPKDPLKGFWRITELGSQFAAGHACVWKTAVIFNNRLLRYEGGAWSIQDSLNSPGFEWDKLMNPRWDWSSDPFRKAVP